MVRLGCLFISLYTLKNWTIWTQAHSPTPSIVSNPGGEHSKESTRISVRISKELKQCLVT